MVSYFSSDGSANEDGFHIKMLAVNESGQGVDMRGTGDTEGRDCEGKWQLWK